MSDKDHIQTHTERKLYWQHFPNNGTNLAGTLLVDCLAREIFPPVLTVALQTNIASNSKNVVNLLKSLRALQSVSLKEVTKVGKSVKLFSTICIV